MTAVLCLVFFLSGASALVFENLWFRQAGLVFGGTVWASSLVFAGFMGGLAVGNGLTARFGWRVVRPVRLYALLEGVVGLSGWALVTALPSVPVVLAPWFRPLLEAPLALGALRFGVAFALLLVPSTAMGATLPLLVKGWHRHQPGFGHVLGRLYGWNTLGAMTGTLAVEEWLVPSFGIQGSAVAAASCNALAMLACLTLLSGLDRPLRPATEPSHPPAPAAALDHRRARILAAAFLSGATLLALEVVWFRFMQLFVASETRTFAIMLMVVLLGIGGGGLLAGLWLRLRPGAHHLFSHLALASGALVVGCYAAFPRFVAAFGAGPVGGFVGVAWIAVWLMLPVSLLSGLLFTFLGQAAFECWREETRTAGWITMANTIGATLGSVSAGWLLLPVLGIERSLFALALAYVCVALVAPGAVFWRRVSKQSALAFGAVLAGALAAVASFPFGSMERRLVPLVAGRWTHEDTRIAAVREGLNETIVYLEHRWLGEPVEYRLITNAYSMSGTSLLAKRYMKQYVYWPLAFHPRVERALLISYGVGLTAKALTDSKEIERIDVVDISRDVVEMNRIVYPDPDEYPPDDPRVRVFVEDGRQYLLVSDASYDLITAEPPPLRMAGVVNLYTQEYFELLRSRLRQGGFVTYWLPVQLLNDSDARHIIRGFCNAFPDCSLWSGMGWQWMLVGSRGAGENGPVDRATFERQWRDPRVLPELTRLGFETPELLLTTFLADADYLHELTAADPPLVDDQPFRIARELEVGYPLFERILDYDEIPQRFTGSTYLHRLVPPELAAATPPFFPVQALVEETGLGNRAAGWRRFDALLRATTLRTPVQWYLGDTLEHTGAVERLAAAGSREPSVELMLGIRALARREPARAAPHFAAARAVGPRAYQYEILAYGYAGRPQRAQDVSRELALAHPEAGNDSGFWDLVERRFSVPNPYP